MASTPPPSEGVTIATLADLAKAAGADVAELLALTPGELMEMLVSEFSVGVIPRKRIAAEHAAKSVQAAAALVDPPPAPVVFVAAAAAPAPATPVNLLAASASFAVLPTAPCNDRGGELASSLLQTNLPLPARFGIAAPLMDLLESANVRAL
jgi:hypothetical protein